ncbi:cob(I)yrinic acid a,c-diamide adenosyltransferase [Nitrosococcus wardiae]|uniref:Corrinoid adenosyltransferase n=1 Tax=Nitrosococcus wardiae TaxID=1814290 RepID=A0A4P7BXM0_9GAMM|nr:cob(I)yrinic acid a,c-diamide adenosyltransferase [Nitrosococcus wardiae]QBQ54908.1 cob(I)yrinic acid a,c-diamide adenosyltransferase [Nitrosococcus wardiae]
MGHRLSKIYTRTGDQGTTGLGNQQRVPKDHPRVEAIGTIDELNALLGLLLAHPLPTPLHQAITSIQHQLFDLGGELSIPPAHIIEADQVQALERQLDTLNEKLPPLKEFILPGGAIAASLCHLARVTCRQAERRLVTLSKEEAINPESLKYLNRLSDLLFVMARELNRAEGVTEILWEKSQTRIKP